MDPLQAIMSLLQAPQAKRPVSVRPDYGLTGAQVLQTQKSPYERTLRAGETRSAEDLQGMLAEVILAAGAGVSGAGRPPSVRPNRKGVDVLADETGGPLKVFHGSPTGGFKRFDRGRGGSNSGDPAAKEGIFFTSSPGEAAFYGRLGGPGESIIPAHLRMKNPLHVEYAASTRPDVLRAARAAGHDGVIDARGDYIVFSPEQVISAVTGR